MKIHKPMGNFLPDVVLGRIADPAIQAVGEKLINDERLTLEDGLACFNTQDLIGLGQIASAVKRSRYGNKAFFISNHHLNYTNVCENKCRFCAFHRAPDSEDAHTYSPEEAARQISQSPVADLREIHIVGGCHPHLELDYYTDLLEALIQAQSTLKLKAFTAVEIDHMASKAGISALDCLKRLKDSGLSAMPGGGG